MDANSSLNLRKNCPHCDPNLFAMKYPLEETTNFRVVCDVHPLIEGHILLIPKKHISCIGEYPEKEYKEFLYLFDKYSNFLKKAYGVVSAFEHGKTGQTVFHSHTHLLPFDGFPTLIIPEGQDNLFSFTDFSHLKDLYKKEGKYLFFSISSQKWAVNTQLGYPGFFRDRFAKALNIPERGNWKDMRQKEDLMNQAATDIQNLQNKWKAILR